MTSSSSDAPRAGPGTSWLAAILLVALGLRLWGLFFGLPLDLRPDERFYQQAVANMVERGDLHPGGFAYPGLPFTLLLGTLRVTHLVAGWIGAPIGARPFEAVVEDVPFVTRFQRLLAALLGTLTVLLVWPLARRVGGRWAALVATTLLATSPLHVMHSHFGVVDVPAACFVTAALLAIVAAAQQGGRGRFAAAGLLAGLATAMRYLPAALAVAIAIAVLAARRREGRPHWWLATDGRLLIAAFAMIAGFLVGAPFTVLDFEGFRAGFLAPFFEGTIGLGQRGGWETFEVYAGVALRHGLTVPVAFAVALGCGLALVRPRASTLVVLVTIVIYGGLLLTARKMFFRYLIPLVPALLVLAAVVVAPGLAFLERRRRGFGILGLATLLALPFLSCMGSNRLLARPSSFASLRAWLEAPEQRALPVTFTSEVVAEIVDLPERTVPLDPAALRTRRRAIWLVAARHPHPALAPPDGPLGILAPGTVPVATQDVGALDDAVFESRDRWFHPYAGAFGLEADGPSWAAYRLEPGTLLPAAAGEVPKATGLHVFPFSGDLAVSWQAPGDDDPVAWVVRHLTVEEAARRQAAGRAELDGLPRLVVPGGERSAVLRSPGAGRYVVLVSALGPMREGPPALAPLVEVP